MQYIIKTAERILLKYGGRNIIETAENSGAKVWFRELGGLKGFYICEKGKRYIVINEELDEIMTNVVCAHELGHDMLHREMSEGGIRESTLFLKNNSTEREANLFAAEVLIPDSVFFEALEGVDNARTLASELRLPLEIIEYKLEILNFKGHKFKYDRNDNGFLR